MNLLASFRYLVALDEHRHFGRAAQACHITQPALSNALRALESEFGVVIVRRGRAFGGLTHEGEQVLQTARRMLRDNEALRQQISDSAGHLQGTLRMAAVPTAIPILSRFAALVRARHPGIMPVVLSMSSNELEAGLENLSLDLALGYTERSDPRHVKSWPQYVEHYFLLRQGGGETEALRIVDPVTWQEAAQEPLCLLTSEMHNRSLVDGAFRAAGNVVKPAMETNSVLTLSLAVSAGGLCSILPGAVVAAVRSYRGLVAAPLVSPELLTPIGFMANSVLQPSLALAAALGLLSTKEWRLICQEDAGALT